MHRVWIVFSQLKILLLTWSGTAIPSISLPCTQSRRRFTQVIHRFVHRSLERVLPARQQRISHGALTPSYDTDESHDGRRGSSVQGTAVTPNNLTRYGFRATPHQAVTWGGLRTPGSGRHC
jgi:hypothetical protein